MGDLYDRVIKLTIDNRTYEDFRVSFNADISLLSKPNTANISIFNLSRATREAIKKSTILIDRKIKGSQIFLEAGYTGMVGQVFMGEVTKIEHDKNATDWITKLEVKDGYTPYSTTNLEKSFKSGTSLKTVIESIVDAMGLDDSNISTVDAELRQRVFDRGFIISGSAILYLDIYAKQLGASWSIKDNKFVLLKNGVQLTPTAILISKETGLIGHPKRTNKGYNFTALLNHKIIPGALIKLDSDTEGVNNIIVEKVSLSGDNWEKSFYSKIEGIILPWQSKSYHFQKL